ncbi:hypothetical protein VTK26DRAFT_2955 [Humicola hyalothermophila]
MPPPTTATTTTTKMGTLSGFRPHQPLDAAYYASWTWTMGIYWNMPADAECVFSICDEVRVKRSIPWSRVPFYRDVEYWSPQRIQAKANSIRARYPEQARRVVRPTSQIELYKYFDAIDLYTHGAYNLLWVILRLCDENDGIVPLASQSDRFDVVDDWVYKWCTHAENRRKLGTWNRQGDILDVMTPDDWMDIGVCPKEAVDFARGVLKYWHAFYFGTSPVRSALQDPSDQASHGRRSSSGLVEPVMSCSRVQNDGTLFHPQPSSHLFLPYIAAQDRPNSAAPATTEPAVTVTPRPATGRPVIVNGSRVAGGASVTGQLQLQLQHIQNGETAEHVRRARHKPSKSGPIPAAQSLASQIMGVEQAGPSRLPNRPRHLPALPNGSPQEQTKAPARAPGGNGNLERRMSPPSEPYNVSLHDPRRPSFAPHCKNRDVVMGRGYRQARPCDCDRCKENSRSVHVRLFFDGDLADGSRKRDVQALAAFFGRWGNVENCNIKRANATSRPFAFVRFTSEQSAIRAVEEADGLLIPALHCQVNVTHPWGSKHHVPKPHSPPRRDDTTPPRRRYSPNNSTGSGDSSSRAKGRASPQGPVTPVRNHGQPLNNNKKGSRMSPPNSLHHSGQRPVHVAPGQSWDLERFPAQPASGAPRSASSMMAQPSRSSPPHHQHPEGHPFFPPHHAPGFWPAGHPSYDGPFHHQLYPAAQGPLPQQYSGPPPPYGWMGMPGPAGFAPPWHHGHPYPPHMLPQAAPAPQHTRGHRRSSAASSRVAYTPNAKGPDYSNQAAKYRAPPDLATPPSAGHRSETGNAEQPMMQTKPPSEEVLSDIHLSGATTSTPSSAGSSSEGIRVRLPSNPSERLPGCKDAREATPKSNNNSSSPLGKIPEEVPEPAKNTSKSELPPTSHLMIGDVRLEPGFTGTVIYRPQRKQRFPEIPPSWMNHDDKPTGP